MKIGQEIVYIPPEALVLETNLRTGDLRIDDMVRDLLAAGCQLQPIGIDPELHVLFGFRRAAALQKIVQEKLVPKEHVLSRAACIMIENGDRLKLQILENSARINFSPIEEAKILDQLRRVGYKLESAAAMFGKTKGWAGQRLSLLRLPEDVQQMIPDTISAWHGYLLSQMDEKTMRRKIAAMHQVAPKPKGRHDLGAANRKKLLRQLENCRVKTHVRPLINAVIQLLRGEIDLEQFLSALENRA